MACNATSGAPFQVSLGVVVECGIARSTLISIQFKASRKCRPELLVQVALSDLPSSPAHTDIGLRVNIGA